MYPLFWLDVKENWTLWTNFHKVHQYQLSWISAQWEPSCSMRTDGQTDKTKISLFFFEILPKRLKQTDINCLIFWSFWIRNSSDKSVLPSVRFIPCQFVGTSLTHRNCKQSTAYSARAKQTAAFVTHKLFAHDSAWFPTSKFMLPYGRAQCNNSYLLYS